MTSISLSLTPPQKCSYLDHKESQSSFVYPPYSLDTPLYSTLITHGFRRSGDEVYRPACPACIACIACRIPIKHFKATRTQKRCLKKNSATQILIQEPCFKPQHFELYQRYQTYKHPDSPMANSTAEEYIHFLNSAWCDTIFVEFFLNNTLIAVAVVDVLDQSLSAVYTFFDPDFSAYSLGVYAILWQIEYAQSLHLNYVYLGYWIEKCRKMAYKTQYHPLEGFIDQQWKTL
jgi:arginine-tRNA-protein transferase